MKYIVSFLLLGLLAAPAMAQRPHRGDFKKQYQRVEKHVGEKGCPKCGSLRKQIVTLKKALAEAKKADGKAGKRGRGRSDRGRGSRSEGRKGSRGDRGHGRWTPRNGEKRGRGQQIVPWKRKDVDVDALRKNWREQLQKKFGGRATA